MGVAEREVAAGMGVTGPTTIVEDEAPLGRRLAAEFVGTLLFVAIGTGAATVLAFGPLERIGGLGQLLTGPGAAQEPVFQALLSNTLADLLPVALAFAVGLATLVYAFGGVSGAHFNPAVTLALAISRRFRWGDVIPYIVAQCLGAIGGAFVIAGIYKDAFPDIKGADVLFGATVVNIQSGTLPGLDFLSGPALLAEAFIAFVLMTAIMAVAIDPRAPKGWSGLIIGLALGAGILVTGAATGGSANFARSLGPFVAGLVFDAQNIPWADLATYAIGPLVGATAAALIYEAVTGLETGTPAPEPGAATHDEGGVVATSRPVVTPEGTTTGLPATRTDTRREETPPPGL